MYLCYNIPCKGSQYVQNSPLFARVLRIICVYHQLLRILFEKSKKLTLNAPLLALQKLDTGCIIIDADFDTGGEYFAEYQVRH